jgi:hypothetical protein
MLTDNTLLQPNNPDNIPIKKGKPSSVANASKARQKASEKAYERRLEKEIAMKEALRKQLEKQDEMSSSDDEELVYIPVTKQRGKGYRQESTQLPVPQKEDVANDALKKELSDIKAYLESEKQRKLSKVKHIGVPTPITIAPVPVKPRPTDDISRHMLHKILNF